MLYSKRDYPGGNAGRNGAATSAAVAEIRGLNRSDNHLRRDTLSFASEKHNHARFPDTRNAGGAEREILPTFYHHCWKKWSEQTAERGGEFVDDDANEQCCRMQVHHYQARNADA